MSNFIPPRYPDPEGMHQLRSARGRISSLRAKIASVEEVINQTSLATSENLTAARQRLVEAACWLHREREVWEKEKQKIVADRTKHGLDCDFDNYPEDRPADNAAPEPPPTPCG